MNLVVGCEYNIISRFRVKCFFRGILISLSLELDRKTAKLSCNKEVYSQRQLFLLGSRDKPKRYSSQRQKTGTSMMDIPAQIPESEEARQYMEQISKFISIIFIICCENKQ